MVWPMLYAVIAILVGFILLVWTADRFVLGASAIARNFGVAPLIIGLTIVGLGTSAPEVFVSVMAALNHNTGLAVGNAIGSNIANIGLVLGVTSLVAAMVVKSELLKREFPILLAITIAASYLLFDAELSRVDGVILLAGLVVMLYWIIGMAKRSRVADPMRVEYAAEIPKGMPTKEAVFWFTLGLIGLVISSRLLVWGAVVVAKDMGVSDLVIGLTIVAIGTSLPELAASVVSALKNEPDIAIGNIIGSNMYNLLAVMGIAGIIHPATVPEIVSTRDLPVMIGLTIMLYAMAYGFRGSGRLSRFEGGILLSCFLAYQLLIYMDVASSA